MCKLRLYRITVSFELIGDGISIGFMKEHVPAHTISSKVLEKYDFSGILNTDNVLGMVYMEKERTPSEASHILARFRQRFQF